MSDQVTKTPVEILVPWQARVIPRRCRNPRTIYVRGSVHAEIRTPAPDEARVAFRLSSGRSRRSGGPAGGWTEVVHCDGLLWWPISPGTDDIRSRFYASRFGRNRAEGIGAELLLRSLRDGAYDLLALRGVQNIDLFEDLVAFDDLPLIRVWEEDNRQQMETLAQRRASNLLMLWKGAAYVRGGEPVFAQHPLGEGHSDDGIANTGADRSVDPYATGLSFDVGRFEYGQRAFAAGKFQRADQRSLAEANRSTITRTVSKFLDVIEVLMPEAIRLDRAAVRLDAIYRTVDRALRGDEDPYWADIRGLFAEVSARDPAGVATSADRYDALAHFSRLAAGRDDLPEELLEAYECFLTFETSEDASSLDLSTLEAEDDAALGDLGGSVP